MNVVEDRLKSMGYELPPPFAFPSSNRCGCVRVGTILYISGHGLNLPAGPAVRQSGRLGQDMTEAEGYATARAVMLTILSTVKAEVGSLDKVKRIIRLFGMCNATPDFVAMPRVIDGASDLVYELFGPDAGRHARTAVGMATLPRGIAVEINGEIEVLPD
jgi:enamine deaminase RidA (YjgF/YER057c/UK114 family)